jgi:hypothetical protein
VLGAERKKVERRSREDCRGDLRTGAALPVRCGVPPRARRARNAVAAALGAVMLAACAHPRSARVSSMTPGDVDVQFEGGEEPERWFRVVCPSARTSCTRTAGLLCPGGYVVVNGLGGQIQASLGGLPQVQNSQLRVRCLPAFLGDGI